MIYEDKLNPFKAGDGIMPPQLSGRESEQEVLDGYLSRMRAGEPNASNIIVIAPRANGKTTLLRWFRQQVEQQSRGAVDVVWVRPNSIRTPAMLLNKLAPMPWFRKLLRGQDDERYLTAQLAGASPDGAMNDETEAAESQLQELLTERLIRRCRRKPLVAIVDDAHTLHPGAGRVLLNAAQDARAEAPFLLVLAGAPGLQARLNRMNATFWGCSRRLSPGPLSRKATRETLSGPLSQVGITLTEDALESVTMDSQGYPFFIQLWGEALFDLAQMQGLKIIDENIMAAAQEAVDNLRADYYEDRCQELKAAELLSAAVAVSDSFQQRKWVENEETAPYVQQALRILYIQWEWLRDVELAEALRESALRMELPYGMEAQEAEHALRDMGYIWQPGKAAVKKLPAHPKYGEADAGAWVPGIPSLTAYLWKRFRNPEPPPELFELEE